MIPLPFEKARDLPVHLITSIDTIITEKYPPTPAAKPEVEPPTKTTLKVKLKVGSNKSTEPQEKQKLVNTKKTDHPKITLKLSAKKVEEDRISDDEYVAEEADADEYMEDDDAIDAVEDIPLDSDDDDYEEAKPSASRKRRNNRKPASRSRVKETYTAPAYDSASSSEDDLGTSKKIKRTPSRPSLSSLAASKKATSTTARQRLLERIQNFRK
ncbi:uncharacterized protein BYT42DRAFT_35203 [Radiomyces spectabilis]|uniref:uncharacterized protein n=1 Tax=Radiomyces spectabilis TaxID=64574 RepID=UPI002220EE2D|nr:uncharacterized protein BYT42DRAFT_35203 [Radiomyces spectabilis]KAI8394219.1 hypothetical protein BYT42DRAFT_35203 [Radiomyces spectabilis]